MTMRLRFSVAALVMLLSACSSDDSSSNKQSVQQTSARPPTSGAGGGVPPVGQSAVPGISDEPVKPNRSELRVMTEDAKATENAVKNVIERFDANLSDRQARESAQNEFKAMLPDYKEKMLQIGKAKMKGESHPVETP